MYIYPRNGFNFEVATEQGTLGIFCSNATYSCHYTDIYCNLLNEQYRCDLDCTNANSCNNVNCGVIPMCRTDMKWYLCLLCVSVNDMFCYSQKFL